MLGHEVRSCLVVVVVGSAAAMQQGLQGPEGEQAGGRLQKAQGPQKLGGLLRSGCAGQQGHAAQQCRVSQLRPADSQASQSPGDVAEGLRGQRHGQTVLRALEEQCSQLRGKLCPLGTEATKSSK
jgi:hypothetical protein